MGERAGGEGTLSHDCGRWIVVADSPFVPALDGGSREHEGFVAAAAGAGRLAVLVVPTDEGNRAALHAAAGGAPVVFTPRDRRTLQALHPRTPYVVASRPSPRGLADEVRALAAGADGIVLFSYKSHRLGTALARGLGLPMVLRAHNREGVYHRALAQEARGPRRVVLSWEATRVARDERALETSPLLTGIADISAVDAAARQALGAVPVRHVPTFARSARPPEPRAPRPGRVLFVGTLSVATNVAGLHWLLDEVWPLVRSDLAEAHLVVVGRDPSPDLTRRLAVVGATVHAGVDDLGGVLAEAAVAVAPTVTGSGANIKMVDYLHAGVPVVAARSAAAPHALADGEGVRTADDARAFAAAVVGLLRDRATAERLGASGPAALDRLADPRRGLAVVADLLRAEA